MALEPEEKRFLSEERFWSWIDIKSLNFHVTGEYVVPRWMTRSTNWSDDD